MKTEEVREFVALFLEWLEQSTQTMVTMMEVLDEQKELWMNIASGLRRLGIGSEDDDLRTVASNLFRLLEMLEEDGEESD